MNETIDQRFSEGPKDTSAAVSQDAHKVDGDDDKEEKQIAKPTSAEVQKYFKYGFGYILNTPGTEIRSGFVRQEFANNTGTGPSNEYFYTKKYMPDPSAVGKNRYPYSPRIVIRAELEHLGRLKIAVLKDVQDPNVHRGVKWWQCTFTFRRLQLVWNEASVEERRELYKFIKAQSDNKGGFVDWKQYVGRLREPTSVNSIINVDEEPDYNMTLN